MDKPKIKKNKNKKNKILCVLWKRLPITGAFNKINKACAKVNEKNILKRDSVKATIAMVLK